jgi:Predicted membrane protein (DUF2254)
MGTVLGAVLGLIVSVIDEHFGAPSLWHYSPSTASAVLTSIVSATAALTGFVVTVTVLLVQMATGTFSTRILRLWYRDPLLKATLAVLVGTLTFSFSVLRRIGDDSPPPCCHGRGRLARLRRSRSRERSRPPRDRWPGAQRGVSPSVGQPRDGGGRLGPRARPRRRSRSRAARR